MSHSLAFEVDPAFIRPLGAAQNEFLQVLLTEFQVRPEGRGLVLEVAFDFDTPAVWLRRGKVQIHRQLNPDSIRRYQRDFEELLLGNVTRTLDHRDPAFPFRFGNGGTLPVIRIGEEDYYCLFYRDIEPIGWNIANGGAESTGELIDPLATIERELREELIVVDPVAGSWNVFDWDEGRQPDHIDFTVAHQYWREVFRERGVDLDRELTLPLKWLRGNDRVVIHFGKRPPIEVAECILNINAEDFGIEIDRVAKLALGSGSVVLCDGEMVRGLPLDRVIGLFETGRFHAALAAGRAEFFPDRVFHHGLDRTADGIHRVVEAYLEDVTRRGVWAPDVREAYEAATCRFGLCPVTRNLIRRRLLLDGPEIVPPASPPDVFLSFASEALPLAERVHAFLGGGGHRVFFSQESLHEANFGEAIDRALQEARSLVVVGMRTEHFYKGWVQYEWRSFHNDILGGRKPSTAALVTLTEAPADLLTLPRPLTYREVVECDPQAPEPAFQRIGRLLA
jgi:hypothetical protein